MLQETKAAGALSAQDVGTGTASDESINFDRLLSALRRQWRIAAGFAFLGLLIGLAYVMTAVPRYSATADVLIDQGSNRIIDQISSSGAAPSMEDEAAVLSQVEILRSNQIALKVVDELNLTQDPNFTNNGSLLGTLILRLRTVFSPATWFGDSDPGAEGVAPGNERQQAAAALFDNLSIDRVGRSYVLRITYTSPDPAQAARIAQSVADAYLTDQLDSKYESTRRASGWLQQRIEELRQQSLTTDLAVQKFRADNNLISTNGQLVSDQQLTELSTQLTAARAEVATARARYERIESLIAAGDTDAVVNDALASSVISQLRTKYLETSRRATELTGRLGPNHVQVQRLQLELDNYRQLMFGELERIATSYRNDLEVAQAREASLSQNVSNATNQSAASNQTQVQLRELEREADTYRNLYQTFLQRYQEAIQQQSFPITEARVITRAEPPMKPSRPRKALSVALAIFLGGAAGAGIGAYREFRDRFFRRGDQVREELGFEFLGSVPLLKGAQVRRARKPANLGVRQVHFASPLSRYVLDNAMSSFAETMRSAKIAADVGIQRKCRVIGVVSVLPSEGKSTISLSFAELMAAQGASVLLIDGDIRNPGVTRAVGNHATTGLVDTLLHRTPLSDAVMTDDETKLAVLPAVSKHRVTHTAELLSSEEMDALLADAARVYDYVVIDLPPMGPVVDTRAIASKVDGFVFVVEWGRTARNVVRSTIAANPTVARKCLGVILNKVDVNKMKLYRDFGSDEYYHNRYASYYQHG